MFWLTRRELISALFITRVTGVLDGFCTSSKKIKEEENIIKIVIICQENGLCDTPVQNGKKIFLTGSLFFPADLKFENEDTEKFQSQIHPFDIMKL
jgi:hypothetical protein